MPQAKDPNKSAKIALAEKQAIVYDEYQALCVEVERLKEEKEKILLSMKRAKTQTAEAKDTYRAFGFALKDRESRLTEEKNLFNKEVVSLQKQIYALNTDIVNITQTLVSLRSDIEEEQAFLSQLKSKEVQCKTRLEDSAREIKELGRLIAQEKTTLREYEEKRFMVEGDILQRKNELTVEQHAIEEQKEWIRGEKDKLFMLKSLLQAFAREHNIKISF